jgi:hypothetical protein
MLAKILILCFIGLFAVTVGQDAAAAPVCSVNQLFNGQICTCAPGYFSSSNEESRSRCEDECEEVYFTFFTYGKCTKGLFDRVGEDQQPACNMRCGMRIRFWASIALFAITLAALFTIFFTLPMCIATCASCLHAKKAKKHSKKMVSETQLQTVNTGTLSKDQQMQAYNPYGYGNQAYWPYGYSR